MEDGIDSCANYRVASQIQTTPCGPADGQLHDVQIRDAARRCGLTVTAFKERLAATSRKVDSYFARGLHHRIFKGKWFAVILADHIDRIMAGVPYYSKGLNTRLPPCLAATLDFTEPWAEHFRTSIRDVAAML